MLRFPLGFVVGTFETASDNGCSALECCWSIPENPGKCGHWDGQQPQPALEAMQCLGKAITGLCRKQDVLQGRAAGFMHHQVGDALPADQMGLCTVLLEGCVAAWAAPFLYVEPGDVIN